MLRFDPILSRIDLTLGSSSHLTETDLQVSDVKSDYFGGTRPTFGAFLTMNVPIFDGFARRLKKASQNRFDFSGRKPKAPPSFQLGELLKQPQSRSALERRDRLNLERIGTGTGKWQLKMAT